MKKAFVISAKDEFELVKKINESKLEIKATQPMQKKDGTWVAFIYHSPCFAKDTQGVKSSFSTPTKSKPSEFKIKPETLNKWANEDVTPKQRKVLSNFMSDVQIEDLSKLDAYKIIREKKK